MTATSVTITTAIAADRPARTMTSRPFKKLNHTKGCRPLRQPFLLGMMPGVHLGDDQVHDAR
jgi:hypothetical protein